MRRLTFLVVILAAVYSGYWFVGARAVERGATQAITDANNDGWAITYSELNTRGFPSRFDTTLDQPAVTPPDGLWSWTAPFLQVFALSYQPNRVIAAFPPTQYLRLGDQSVTINSDRLRASAGVKVNAAAAFDDATVEVGPADITSDLGWSARIAGALIAARADDEAVNQYDVYADVKMLVLSPDLIRQIDGAAGLGDTIDHITLDGVATLDRPLDRFALAEGTPLVDAVKLNKLSIKWGDVILLADGAIKIDALGIPDGRVTFKTAQWREIIDVLADTGAFDRGVVPTIKNVARSMAADGGMLELPISFQNGFMSVGPLPLGPAPRLR